MRPVHSLFLLRVLSLLALSTSLALLLDYVSPQMAFCSGASGCEKVRQSGFGYLVLPSGAQFPYLPLLGFVGFASIFSSSLLRRSDQLRSLLLPLSWAAALGGVVLIALQAFVVGGFCSLCVIVDACALIVGLCAFDLRGDRLDAALMGELSDITVERVDGPLSESHRVLQTWQEDSVYVPAPHPTFPLSQREPLRLTMMGWLTLALIALLAPLSYSTVVSSDEVPQAISALYEPGKVNVVEFFDYQCPHCRVALPTVRRAVEEYSGRVHVVRLPVYLPGHPLGKVAGRVHVCATEQGEQETIFEVLLSKPQLSPELIEQAETAPGIDRAKMASCLESERPDRVLDEAIARIKQTDFVGLPTTYIGSERLLGAQPQEAYLAALHEAGRRGGFEGVSGATYWLLVALLCLVVGVASRARPRSVLEGAEGRRAS